MTEIHLSNRIYCEFPKSNGWRDGGGGIRKTNEEIQDAGMKIE